MFNLGLMCSWFKVCSLITDTSNSGDKLIVSSKRESSHLGSNFKAHGSVSFQVSVLEWRCKSFKRSK